MTPDTAALRALADTADTFSGYVTIPTDTVRALCDAADEVERIRARADELEAEGWIVGGVWGDYGECVVPTSAVEWVVTGHPELTTPETDPDMAATWRDRVAAAEAERDASRTAHAALVADLRDTEALCIALHDAYEAAALRAGWETQAASRRPWVDVPEANKATMRLAVAALTTALLDRHTPEEGS